MSEGDDNIQDQFQEFLKENKIDTTSLLKKDKETLFNAKDQRTLAILRAVSRNSFIILFIYLLFFL